MDVFGSMEQCASSVAQWSNGQCIGLPVERSGFETWPGPCAVFLGEKLYSYSASKGWCLAWVSVSRVGLCVPRGSLSPVRTNPNLSNTSMVIPNKAVKKIIKKTN